MSEELSTTSEVNVPAVVTPNMLVPELAIEEVVKSFVKLPMVRFCTSSSEACKDGLVPVNTFRFEDGTEKIALGGTVECLPVAMRYTALKYTDPVIISHQYESAAFQQIREAADSKDQDVSTGHMWGPEFLIWLPELNSFATFLFGSASSRIQGAKMRTCILAKQPCMIKAEKVVGKKYTWFIPAVYDLSTLQGSAPNETLYTDTVTSFVNAKDYLPEVEVDEAEVNERG